MFRIKICGITSADDALMAIDAGADAIGLNFYPKSSRYVQSLDTTAISHRLDEVQRVGVFVNADHATIQQCGADYGLTAYQLHGDESPEFVAGCQNKPLIRVYRMDDRGTAAITADLAACESAGRLPDAALIDAYDPGHYGGTGEKAPWDKLVDYQQWLGGIPLILAGGLTPENVAEAILAVRPYGVDVASGVESSAGKKDAKKTQAFISNAKAAFSQITE